LAEELRPYAQSVAPFLQLVDPRVSLQETTVWDNEGFVTGTFDLLTW
jgi:hypothetical protein